MLDGSDDKMVKGGRFFYGNIIIAVCFITLLIIYGSLYSFGVFLKPVIAEFGWSRSVTAGAYSLHFIFNGFVAILAGKLTDRFGARWIVTFSGLLLGLSYILLSQITSVWQLYFLYGILLSLGVAAGFVATFSTIARWFIKTRGLASGIISAGIGVGIVVMPPLATILISSYNWRISFMVIGLISLVISVIAQFLKPEPGRLREVIHNDSDKQNIKTSIMMRGFSFQQAIRTRQFWIICAIWFIVNIGVQTIMVHVVAYVTDTGIPAYIAATIMSAIGVASIFGKIGVGGVFDRLGSRSVYIIVGILMLIAFVLIQFPGMLPVLYVFAVVFAVSYAGLAATQSPAIAEYFGLKAHGTIFGAGLFAACLGGAAGPFLTGLIYDMTGSYHPAFAGYATICVAAIILSILLKPTSRNLVGE